jgi:hypothetical protein
VSGFLGRVASRAVGAATVASPRLAGPFGLREVEAPAGPEPARHAEPVSGAEREGRHQPGGSRATSAGGGGSTARTTARSAGPGRPVGGTERIDVSPAPDAEPVTPPRVPSAAAELEEPDPAPAKSSPPAIRSATGAPAPVVPLARATPAVPAPLAPATVATIAAAEQPQVRVHIGRLEVRASLEQPAPQPRRREEPRRPPELSLSDYLRGRQAR